MHRDDLWDWVKLTVGDYNKEKKSMKQKGWKIWGFYPDDDLVIMRKKNKKHASHSRKIFNIMNPGSIYKPEPPRHIEKINWWDEKF